MTDGRIRNLPLSKRYRIDTNGCWLFIGYIDETGYGRVQYNGKVIRAHQAMWKELKGSIPLKMQLDHLCKNRACINPDHLEIVSNAENTRRGKATKLSHDDVRLIKSHLKNGLGYAILAHTFKVSEKTIKRIDKEQRWKGVE